MSPRTNRRRAREVAMQSLYLLDQNRDADLTALFDFVAEQLHDMPLIQFAKNLIEGVRTRQPEIDEILRTTAVNWRIERMSPVDRNILRLAIYEIQYDPAIPPKVAINEALEIAKRFSTDDASRFINGILDRVVREQRSTATFGVPSPAGEPEGDAQVNSEDSST